VRIKKYCIYGGKVKCHQYTNRKQDSIWWCQYGRVNHLAILMLATVFTILNNFK